MEDQVGYGCQQRTIKKHEPTTTGKVWAFHPNSPTPNLKKYKLPHITVSNGIVWPIEDHTRLYCTDGMKNRILSFTYNVEEKTVTEYAGVAFDLDAWILSLERPLYEGHAMLGRMTIDNNGLLWVPLYGGSHVLQIDPHTRKVQQAIRIGAPIVSACVFGGKDLDILYVSTLAYGADAATAGDQGGTIYAVSGLGGVKGHEAWSFLMLPGFLHAYK
ncbi:regucalcin-like [Belonocnema kinseyi]|uniref:regucalcin-like n=1 Tax=Belonocnema kinseyi TaxID=2817044 RepID=UPI00143CFD58|nr:regucalcin-like [Belonocnema kinseyi]